MELAASACVNEGMTIRQAACHFGEPKSTLGDTITGRVVLGAKSCPKPYLTTEEEDELLQLLLRCVSIGYAKMYWLWCINTLRTKEELLMLLTPGGKSLATTILISCFVRPLLYQELGLRPL